MRKPGWFERLIFGQRGWQWSQFAHTATRGRYIEWAFQGRSAAGWPRWAHEVSRWEFYPSHHAERVRTWTDRHDVATSVQMAWPKLFTGLRIRGGAYGTVGHDGRTKGTEMQLGAASTRPLSYGWAEHGERDDTEIPLPAMGHYRVGGYPTPMFDRHCVITDPLDGSVHELIQFDPDAEWMPDNVITRALPNQALNWGRWVDGQLVDNDAITAAKLPLHGYVWTRDSAANPHALALVVPDYIGADGQLTSGPRVGELLCLDADSASYRAMTDLGGECAAVAEALATKGCRVIDRNGYADVKGHQDTVGRQGHPPKLHIHADAYFTEATNLGQLDIAVTDFRRATAA